MRESENEIRITVDPEPSDEELAAIAAVVAQLAARASAEDEAPSPTRGRDRWAKAGRREVLRSIEWEPSR